MSNEALSFSAPDPAELAGLFPGYAVESLIACGGMGAVYHARQIALDREVAIKILPRELSSDLEFRDGFAAEAKAMARLNHPNLIGIYDFGEVDGMLFLIMEFVAGESLYHAAYGRALDWREAANLMAAICAGVAHAHEHGILHRDIKPANILLDGHGRPKIGDFGLARPIGSAGKEGEPIYGTPGYTAPEVVNNPTKVDHRADVFSLGVMLHELLTTKLPSADPRPASVQVGCPRQIDLIIERATQPYPQNRSADVASMAKELANLASGALPAPQIRAGAAPPIVRPKMPTAAPVRRRSGGSGGIWVVIVLLAAGAAAYFYLKGNPLVMKGASQPAPTAPVTEKSTPSIPAPVIPPITPKAPTPVPREPEEADAPPAKQGSFFGMEIPGSRDADAPPPGPKPIFNVEEFLTNARGIMRRRAEREIADRNKASVAIADRFERSAGRAIRDADRIFRDDAQKDLAAAMERVRANGHRFPSGFDLDLRGVDDEKLAEALSEASVEQKKAETAFAAAMQSQAALYVRGIEMQIGRLDAAADPGAVSYLQHEIKLTRQDDSHFIEAIDSVK